MNVNDIMMVMIARNESALFYMDGCEEPWSLHLGNSNIYCMLGEVEGDVVLKAKSLEELLTKLMVIKS